MRFARALRAVAGVVALAFVLLPAYAGFAGKNGRIAYRAGANYIFLTGTGQLTFPGFLQYDFSPAFSADGSKVAFIRQTPLQTGYFYEVLTVRTDGTNLQQVTSSNAFPGLTAFSAISEPAWTPDGHVSFVVRNGTSDQNGIWMDGARVVPEAYSTGESWSPVGKQLAYGCTFRKNALNQDMTDLCVYDAITSVKRQLPINWPEQYANGVGFPKWTPDGERIVFQMGYTTGGGTRFVEHYDIFSIKAAGGGVTQLTNSGPDICPGETASKSAFYWQTPSPSPDGSEIVAFRWTNVRSGTSGCNASLQDRGLYGVSGSRLQLIPDEAYGTDWQPIPVALTLNVEDGHGNLITGLKVELKTTTGQVLNDHPETNGASYFFDGVNPGDYVVRATLTDNTAAPAFELRYPNPDLSLSNSAAWMEQRIKVPVDTHALKKIAFENSPSLTDSSVVAAERDRLDDVANLYFRMHQFVDWVKTSMEPNTGALVPVHAFVDYNPIEENSYRPDRATYYSGAEGGPMILMGTEISDYSKRDGANNEAPENAEWHEYVHHLYSTHIGSLSCAPGSKNHGGYSNPDTCDSMNEGFSSFLPALAAGDITGASDSLYDALWDLEPNTRAWDLRTRSQDTTLVNAEDKAVAALFWDLADSSVDTDVTQFIGADGLHHAVTWTDTSSIPAGLLWGVMKSNGARTVFDLRKALGTPALTLDLDNDGVMDLAPVDQVFLMHGFFPIDTDQTITGTHGSYHYDVGYSQRIVPSAARNDSVGLSSHRAFTAGGSVSKTIIPRLHIEHLPSANVALTVQDASGTPLAGADVALTAQGAELSATARRLGSGNGALMYLELPPYFDYLLPDDASLPACDPASPRHVAVTVQVSVNGYASTDAPATFDNCAWLQAVDAAAGTPSAMSLTATFPSDSTAPSSTIVTTPTDALVSGATLGSWIVALSCDDPAASGFASGCARTEYRLDGGPVTVFGHNITVEGVGTHTFEYRSVDAAGNQEGFLAVSLDITAGAPPTIASFAPASGPVGTAVTINGTNLDRATGVTFNGVTASFTVVSPTQLTATVPAGATSGPIAVTSPGGNATSATSFVVTRPPTIAGFSPASGNVGTSVTITGANLDTTTGVSFNGKSAAFVAGSATQITATVPTGATTGTIAVTNPAGTATSATSFTVTVGSPPSIASFSPASGVTGTAVTINGTNLANATAITFNGTLASFSVSRKGVLTATVPPGASTGPIAVVTPGGSASSSSSFVILAAPTISGFSPTSGPGGTDITVSGTNLTGASSVKIGASNAKFTVVSGTTITATVPKGAKSGVVSVTTAAGTATSTGTFTVTK